MSTSDFAIQVRSLSKLYHIGALQQQHDTLRDALVARLKRPAGSSAKQGDGRNGNTIWALKDVSFDIERGEVIGVVGRNGAGKSTLLKILSRITEPTSGRAEIHGRVGSLLEVGTGFHPELTGRENIYLNGAILGMRKVEIDRQFDNIVAFAEIEKFLDTPVKRYSSGMYVRLAFAVAAHLEPEILLVDEVLAVGDAAFQDKCLGKMGDVARSGRTVLFVSHNLGAVKRLCQHSLWIQAGQVAGLGRTDEIIGSYLEAAASHESTWRAEGDRGRPQTGPVVVRSVSLLNSAGHPGDRFEMDSSFSIEMVYDVLSPLENLRLGFTITSDDGTIVFESKDTDPAGFGLPRNAGTYVAHCYVPGDFLNAGRFYVTVIVDRPHQELLFQRDQLLRFVITATDGSGARAGDTRYGLVRPILTWDHEQKHGEDS